MKRLFIALSLLASPAVAGTNLAGQYRLSEGPDVAGALEILPNHHFRYMLAAGALDERAEGRWAQQGPRVCLFTEPRPVPPVFALSATPPAQPQETDLLVTWPNGRGIAGVDFVLGFASGEPLTGYTQTYGWSMPEGDRRRPIWVELSVPMHNLKSPRIALDGKAQVHVVLTPNDLGLVDFQGECLEARDKAFFLRRGGGEMRFIRQRN
jgi:hypothetical protein